MDVASDDVEAPPTARGRKRREQIIDEAARLFEAQGFHATGIDDIGAAAGITGPGIYRHFDGKDAILMAVFDRLWIDLRDALTGADALPTQAGLDLLVERHIDLAADRPQSIVILVTELRHLPEEYRQRADRNYRRLVDAWATRMAELRPGRDVDEARVVTRALHAAISTMAVHDGIRMSAARRRTITEELCAATLAAF